MYIFIYICSYAQREKQMFEWNIKFLKIVTGRRQTSWLFTQRAAEEMNLGRWGGPQTNPMSSRVEGLNPGPPDYKSSALINPAILPLQEANPKIQIPIM